MIEFTALQSIPAGVVALTLLLLLVGFYYLGYRLNLAKRLTEDHENKGLSTINGALLGLLALLLGFTFSMSNSRFDNRRSILIEEANAIGTVILRTDVYPDSMRQLLRGHLKEYVEARIAFFEAGMDKEKIWEQHILSGKISSKIWEVAANHAQVDNVPARTSQLLVALNEMIDLTTTRRAVGEATIPDSIMYFLFVLCLGTSFLLGYANKDKCDWVVIIGFSLMLSATVFTIIDLDRPRSGLIKMDSFNQKIVELREMF
jgi:hypothetical protein